MNNNLTELEKEAVNKIFNMLQNIKLVIIINGSGGVGKDTICDIVAKHYKVLNVSSVDPIKEIALKNGWGGEKDNISRKFLSDLKVVFSEYNNLSNRYLLDKYKYFLTSDKEIMFVHIREPHDIDVFKSSINNKNCVSLLIRRNLNKLYGNMADDGVENYNYDFYYDNSTPIDEVESNFMEYFENTIIRKRQISMSTHEEILKLFEKQFNMIREQLINGCYNNAVQVADLFSTWLNVKVEELEKENG